MAGRPKSFLSRGFAYARAWRTDCGNQIEASGDLLVGFGDDQERYPFTGVLGHEFVGGEAPGYESWFGKRIVGKINLTRSRGQACLGGRPHFCENCKELDI